MGVTQADPTFGCTPLLWWSFGASLTASFCWCKNSLPKYAPCVHGRVAVWLCGCGCGCVAVWLWLWLCGRVAVAVWLWLCGCVTVWLCGCGCVWCRLLPRAMCYHNLAVPLQGFWLPGGGVDAGEDLATGAVRETKEEGGVDVRVTGVVNLSYKPRTAENGSKYVRISAVFLAEPVDERQPAKSIPDFESAGAVWATCDEVREMHAAGKLRGWEPACWIPFVAEGGFVAPLSILETPRMRG